MRQLYKSAKVIYDAHLHRFDVYYKNFLFWKLDRSYPYDTDVKYPVHYASLEKARDRAIERAESLLETVEIWKKSNGFMSWY